MLYAAGGTTFSGRSSIPSLGGVAMWLIACMSLVHVATVSAQFPIADFPGEYRSGCNFLTTVTFQDVYFRTYLNLTDPGLFSYQWQFFLNDASCNSLGLLVEFEGTLFQEGAPLTNLTLFNVNVTGIHGTPKVVFAQAAMRSLCPLAVTPNQWTVGQRDVIARECIITSTVAVAGQTNCAAFRSSLNFALNSTSGRGVIALASLWGFNGSHLSCGEESERLLDTEPTSSAQLAQISGGDLSQSIPRCLPLDADSVCAGIVDYPVQVNPGATFATMEDDLFVKATPIAWSALFNDTCRVRVSALTCALGYSRCNAPTTAVCASVCDGVQSACSSAELLALNTLLGRASFAPDFTQLCAPVNAPCMQGPTVTPGTVATFAARTNPLPYASCATYTGHACQNVVNYPVFVPGGLSLDDLEQQANDEFFYLFAVAPKGACLRALAKYACSQVFLRCNAAVIPNAPAPFPQLPCRTLCNDYSTVCANFITLDDRLAPNCTANGFYVKGQDDFPWVNTTVSTDLDIVTVCNAGNAASNITVNFQCLWPTVKPENPGYTNSINGGSCSMPCHIPSYSDSDYAVMDATIRFWAAVSGFGLFFTIVTIWVFTDKKHARAQQYLLHMLVCLSPTYLMVIIGLLRHPADGKFGLFDEVCRDNANTWDQGENAFCDAQAIFTTFSVISASIFLFAYVIDLFLTMTFIGHKVPEHVHHTLLWFYRLWAAVSVLVFLIGAGNDKELDGSSFSPWCSIGGQWSKYMWRYLGVIQLVGAVALIVSLALLLRMCGHSRTLDGANVGIYIRPVVFMLIFTGFFLYGFGFSVYQTIFESVWSNGLRDWVLCYIVLVPGGFVDQCGQPEFVPKFHWVTTIQVFASQGTIALLLVGLSGRNLELWRDWTVDRFPATKNWWCCSGSDTRSQVGGAGGTRSKLSKVARGPGGTFRKTGEIEPAGTDGGDGSGGAGGESSRVQEVQDRLAAITAQENSVTQSATATAGGGTISRRTHIEQDNSGGTENSSKVDQSPSASRHVLATKSVQSPSSGANVATPPPLVTNHSDSAVSAKLVSSTPRTSSDMIEISTITTATPSKQVHAENSLSVSASMAPPSQALQTVEESVTDLKVVT